MKANLTLLTQQRIVSASFLSLFSSQLPAATVDTELLLLVDVSGSVSSSEYNLMMQGYANAFRSPSLVDSVISGFHGSVAVSLAFWSGPEQQVVGVDWMQVSDSSSSNAFAAAIDATTRPFGGTTAIGSALSYGSTLFGTEVGGSDNGFQSLVQVIDISGDGEDNSTPPDTGNRAENVRNARDQALASGVDMINGLPIGNAGGDLNGYYTNNVLAGAAGETAAFIQPTATFGDVESALTLKLNRELEAAGQESIQIASVPEPSTATLIVLATTACLQRKRPSPTP